MRVELLHRGKDNPLTRRYLPGFSFHSIFVNGN